MESIEFLDIGREAIFVIIKVSFPIMLTGMFFGVLMSFIQAITQIQENALSFVPKMLAVFGSVLFFSSFIGNVIFSFSEKIMQMIAAI